MILAALAVALVTITASPRSCFELCNIKVRVAVQISDPRGIAVAVGCDGEVVTSSMRTGVRTGSNYFEFKELPACDYTIRAAVSDSHDKVHTAETSVIVLGHQQ